MLSAKQSETHALRAIPNSFPPLRQRLSSCCEVLSAKQSETPALRAILSKHTILGSKLHRHVAKEQNRTSSLSLPLFLFELLYKELYKALLRKLKKLQFSESLASV